jgi:acyl carrier protein
MWPHDSQCAPPARLLVHRFFTNYHARRLLPILDPTAIQSPSARSALMVDPLRDKVRDFILQNYLFTTDTAALGVDDSLLDRGVVDSNGMMEIILFLEEQFGVVMRDDEMVPENLDSVNKIAKFVRSRQGG